MNKHREKSQIDFGGEVVVDTNWRINSYVGFLGLNMTMRFGAIALAIAIYLG
jgi:hypothetical protein